jgi:hypothetical protein
MSELDLSLEIRQIRSIFATIAEVTDLPKLEIEIAELEKAAQVPNIWDDPESAQKERATILPYSYRRCHAYRRRKVWACHQYAC